MDVFGAVVLCSLLFALAWFVFLGRAGHRTSDITDRKQREEWGAQAQIEDRDLGQMVDGQNEYRRRDGRDELTVEGVRRSVGAEQIERLDEADREVRTRRN